MSSQQNNRSVAVIKCEGINHVITVKGPRSLRAYSQKCQITGPSVSTAVPQVVFYTAQARKTASQLTDVTESVRAMHINVYRSINASLYGRIKEWNSFVLWMVCLCSSFLCRNRRTW